MKQPLRKSDIQEEDQVIDVKIGTKEEALWNDILKNTEIELERLRKLLTFNEAILELCHQKLEDFNNRYSGK